MEAVEVHPDYRAAGHPEGRRGHEGLHLDEQSTTALQRHRDRRAGGRGDPLREKGRRGIGHLAEAGRGHLEYADLIGRAEAVLRRSQEAIRMKALALQVEDGIHDVLKHARAGDIAVLGDVPDENGGNLRRLGQVHELECAFAELRNTARAGGNRIQVGRLDGVDDNHPRTQALDLAEHRLQVRFGQDIEVGCFGLDPVAAEAQLPSRFLAGDVEHRCLGCHPRGKLQQEGGFANPRVAAQQDKLAGDDPAAEHAVELTETAADAALRLGLDLRQQDGTGRAWPEAARGLVGGGRFGEAVPRATFRAAPVPLRSGRPAISAGEVASLTGHTPPPRRQAAGRRHQAASEEHAVLGRGLRSASLC